MPNATLFFNHKLTGVDYRRRRAWLEVRDVHNSSQHDPDDRRRPPEIEIGFDLLIGADGAYSAARFHLMKFVRMDFRQEYIDTLWCEFHIKALPPLAADEGASEGKRRHCISPHHLHIWPAKEFMFIAIPNAVRSLPFALSLHRFRLPNTNRNYYYSYFFFLP